MEHVSAGLATAAVMIGQQASQLRPQLRVNIAVSSYAMVGDREKALAAGFDGYISKPIKPETFIQELLTIAGLKSRTCWRW